MASKDESIQKQHVHAQKEHAEWLGKLHGWRAEHRRALSKLAKLQASFMEHEAEIEENLGQIHRHEQHIGRHERIIASQKTNGGSKVDPDALGDHGEFNQAHRQLRARIKKMERLHADTIHTLDETIDKLKEIRADFEANESLDEPSSEEVVHEADVESFPASDPPSFNPGHT